MVNSKVRTAFTLIELLVVVIIIFVLIGLLVPLIGNMQKRANIVKTNTILSMVIKGLATTASERGTSLAAVEHPLAASATVAAEGSFAASPRAVFVRSGTGTAVPLSGELLLTAMDASERSTAGWTAAQEDQVMLRDDLFDDPVAPQFIGMERWKLSVLGIGSKWVSRWEQVFSGSPPGKVIETDIMYFEKEGFVQQTVSDRSSARWDDAADRALSTGLGSVMDELINLDAVASATIPESPSPDNLIHYGRLRRNEADGGASGFSQWFPGTVNSEASGDWISYRLRGPAIVDAWGREVLIARNSDGAFHLVSLGLDGSYKWVPGNDGIMSSTASMSAPDGDDESADFDNILVGMEE